MTAAQAQLGAVIAAGGPRLGAALERTEERLCEVVRGHGPELERHAGDTLAAGGKRLRPMLVFLTAADDSDDRLVAAAVAVELLHMATLVHDDVLDRAPLRRGRPTVFASGGRLAATASGDLLFSRAFAELAGTGSEEAVTPALERLLRARARRADAAGGRVDGGRGRGPLPGALPAQDRQPLRRLLPAGALFGGAPGHADALGAFGEGIGLAFQLLDDVLDVSGPAERTGKPRGTDLLDGTVTLPLILARRRDPSCAGWTCVRWPRTPRAPRRSASASPLPARWRRLASWRCGTWPRRRAGCDGLGLPEDREQALRLVADRVVERYA